MSIYMITGTPTMAMVLEIGRVVAFTLEMISAAADVMAPVRREAGMIILWDDVLKIPLAI